MKHKFSPADLLAGLVLMLFFFSLAVTLTLYFRPLYYFDIGYLHISESSGLSPGVIRENYDALIDYNSLWGPDTLVFPSLSMSESGSIHFQEVKRIFIGFQFFFLLSGAASVLLLVFRRKRPGMLKWAAILSVVVPVVLGILVGANWQWFFVTFHRMVFRNDYWIFDPATDPVITILPDAFFLHCALMILSIVILCSVISYLFYRRLTGKKERVQ